MEHELSSFQERIVLLMSAAVLLRLALWKRRPPWGGIALFGMGALLIRAGLARLGSPEPREYQPMRSEPQPDVVTEGSVESFPASDPPV
jgi:hypothetical protein